MKLLKIATTPPLKGAGGCHNNKKQIIFRFNFIKILDSFFINANSETSPCPLQRGSWLPTCKALNFFVIWISALLLLSCNNISSEKRKTQTDTTIIDSYNRKVSFPQNPQCIVSAAPAITEILFALGEGHRIIARTDYCDYPPEEIKKIQSIGGLETPNIELITALNPDIVIASTHFQKEHVDKLEQLKIPVAVLKKHESFEGAYELIENIALLINAEKQGDSIINKMKTEVEEVKELVSKTSERPQVYFVIGFGKTGDYTAGGNTFISQLIELAGGINIASDLNGWSYSLEKLIEKDPDIILIKTGDKEIFKKTEGYSNLKAVKTDQIYEIDNNLFEITGPRLSEGLKLLYTILHPDNQI